MYFNLYLFVGVEVGLSIPSLAAAELAWLALGVEDTGCNVLRISRGGISEQNLKYALH